MYLEDNIKTLLKTIFGIFTYLNLFFEIIYLLETRGDILNSTIRILLNCHHQPCKAKVAAVI